MAAVLLILLIQYVKLVMVVMLFLVILHLTMGMSLIIMDSVIIGLLKSMLPGYYYGNNLLGAVIMMSPLRLKGPGVRLIMTGWTSSVDGDISHNFGHEDCWIVKIQSPTSIDVLEPGGFKVYPNPFSNQFNIDLGNKTADIYLTDIFGQVLKKMTATGQTTITTDGPPGIYFLQLIFSDNSKINIKLNKN